MCRVPEGQASPPDPPAHHGGSFLKDCHGHSRTFARSHAGNRFILVICDYATRYPEAVPLRSVDAEHVAEELVKLFTRVGVPAEILTDQGSNFMSQLLVEVYNLLHIIPIRTSPYRPQTDGLVERFNQTLKAMLKKAASEDGKD